MSTTYATYTLEVPATNHTIEKLIVKICEETAADPNARVTLKYGTCRLECSDEAERREFENSVSVYEAVSVLWSSKSV